MLLDKKKISLISKVGAIGLAVVFAASYVILAMNLSSSRGPAGSNRQIGNVKNQPDQQKAIEMQGFITEGNNYFDGGNYKEAINSYQKALDIDSSNVDVRVDMGIAYFNLNYTDEAIREFKKATEVNPKHSKAWYNLGVAYKKKNDIPSFKNAWESFLKVSPDGLEAENVKKELESLK
ncbi:MAG: tetratricopeptide repeat protein [Actinobacteria bacterium]|nr:tetratricopeptide repeat protein [Actinomycetota bacterium]